MVEIFQNKNNLDPTFMKSISTENNIQYNFGSENHLQCRMSKLQTIELMIFIGVGEGVARGLQPP